MRVPDNVHRIKKKKKKFYIMTFSMYNIITHNWMILWILWYKGYFNVGNMLAASETFIEVLYSMGVDKIYFFKY